MNRLFIALYLDEDVDVLVAELLRSRGFEVLTTQEAHRLHASDVDQLAYALEEGRAFFTHNRVHFEALAKSYIAQGRSHYGIIIGTRRSNDDATLSPLECRVFQHILRRFRNRVRTRQYVMTLHAEEEMADEELTIFDVERSILTGEIIERQKMPRRENGNI